MKITIEIGKEKHVLKKSGYAFDEHCAKCSLKGKCGQGANANVRQMSIYRVCSLSGYGFRMQESER